MGVPGFFKWLTVRYPKIIVDALTVNEIEVLEVEFQAVASKVGPSETDVEQTNQETAG